MPPESTLRCSICQKTFEKKKKKEHQALEAKAFARDVPHDYAVLQAMVSQLKTKPCCEFVKNFLEENQHFVAAAATHGADKAERSSSHPEEA